MNNFGDFLYTLRKEKAMTQAELANLLGVTNKAVSKWETGEAMPETNLLLPISRIFGVTVDELLEGKRNNDNDNAKEIGSQQSEEDSSKEYNLKEEDIDYIIKSHIFKRGKDDKKTTLDKVGGLVCTCVFFLSLITYLILGVVGNMWNPYWLLIPISALTCGIIGIIFDLCNAKKRNQKIQRGEHPYVGAICGIVMLLCIITYLICGVFFSLWHPLWILIIVGAFVCSVIGIVGNIFSNVKKS